MRVAFIGPPATGKTIVSRHVARELEQTFTDTDAAVEEQYGPIPEIFSSQGERFFREREREAVAEALTHEGIISLGGGAILDPRTQEDLARGECDVIYLTMSIAAAEVRMNMLRGTRPLTGDAKSWVAVFEARRSIYERLADYTVDTSHGPVSRVVDEIVMWLRGRHGQI